MSVKYEFDYQEVDKLEKKIKRIPGNIENIINSYLHHDGAKIVVDEITEEMPMSKVRNKRHAKTSRWSRVEKDNLGFTVKPKGGAANRPFSFGYLVFPNEGRGPHNPLEQRFMEEGLEKATPRIIQDIHELLDTKLKEAFE
jgi:hypothetical protein